MGYKSSNKGYNNANKFKVEFIKLKNSVINNFNDMDFENANKQQDMAQCILDIINECEKVITGADALDFE